MNTDELLLNYPNIVNAKNKSARALADLQKNLPKLPGEVSIVANGSLARREITSQSDFDAYPLYVGGSKKAAQQAFSDIRSQSNLKEFAEDGAFGQPVPAITVKQRIGGQGDDNLRFTRRMLLLLESICIGDDKVYRRTMEDLVCRYINDDITDKQIGRFLLNDIVRFYRTMCVDFEFKTVEQKKPKPWGIRYTKLIFSRKLIYFSGVVMCAEIAGMPAVAKRDKILLLSDMAPIDRLLYSIGDGIYPALREYDKFLELLDDPAIRTGLSKVALIRSTHTPEFREVKESGHRFSSTLVKALSATYKSGHPIHEALLV